jgi:hypothetical protein
VEAEPEAPAPGISLEGRVLVKVAPVPDFDRLLNLDSALGRMSEVRNVTLADYTKDEVTFRIELVNPLDSGEFSRQLGSAAGYRLEINSATAGEIDLRLSSGN